ncbi:MAG TPA: hypothetical protein PKC87_03835 [Candidatus Absconditabacterales bacterium]|nr:hypothetical protein [Candidatus Absconditabacterales bacterium]
MTAKKKLLKVFIIIILAIFLLSTGLISVLYLGGNTPGTGDVLSGDIIVETGTIDTEIIETGTQEDLSIDTEIVPLGTVAPIIVTTGNK